MPLFTFFNICFSGLGKYLFFLYSPFVCTEKKKLIRLMTFSNFYDHTNSLFIKLSILKMCNLVFYCNAAFMHEFYNGKLPEVFLHL